MTLASKSLQKAKLPQGKIAKCLEAMASSQAVSHPHMATLLRGSWLYVAHEPTPTTHGHGL